MGGNNDNTRYSALSQITARNVTKLGGAWLKEFATQTRTPPVVFDGKMYINDATTIYAIDPKTGETLWKYTPQTSAPARGGVAVGDGLVFCGLLDAHVVALKPLSYAIEVQKREAPSESDNSWMSPAILERRYRLY